MKSVGGFVSIVLLLGVPQVAGAQIGQTIASIDRYPVLNTRPGAVLRLSPDQKCDSTIDAFVEVSTPAFFKNTAQSLWRLLSFGNDFLDFAMPKFNCSATVNSTVVVNFVVSKKVCATTTLRRVPDNGAVTGVDLNTKGTLPLTGDCSTASFPPRPDAVRSLVEKLWAADVRVLYKDPKFPDELDRAGDPDLALLGASFRKWELRATAAELTKRYRKLAEAGHPAGGFYAAREIFNDRRLGFALYNGKRPMDLLSEPLVLLARSGRRATFPRRSGGPA